MKNIQTTLFKFNQFANPSHGRHNMPPRPVVHYTRQLAGAGLYQMFLLTGLLVKLSKKRSNLHAKKWIWKCQQNGGHFATASIFNRVVFITYELHINEIVTEATCFSAFCESFIAALIVIIWVQMLRCSMLHWDFILPSRHRADNDADGLD